MNQIDEIDSNNKRMQEFRMEFISNPLILICGDRFSGRSTLCSRLLQQFPVPEWQIYCGTRDREEFWDENTAHKSKVSRYSVEKFESKQPMGFVFDEVIDWNHGSEEMSCLFYNQVCPIFVTTPTIQVLPQFILDNVQYVFCLRLRRKEWQRIVNKFGHEDSFDLVPLFQTVTEEKEKYNSIVFSGNQTISVFK
jgi:hypothetical protein